MKLDYELLGDLLAKAEEETLPTFIRALQEWEKSLLSEREQAQGPSLNPIFGHLKLLGDEGYIEGVNVTVSFDGHFQIEFGGCVALTMRGYELLTVLRDKKLLNRVLAFMQEKGSAITIDLLISATTEFCKSLFKQ